MTASIVPTIARRRRNVDSAVRAVGAVRAKGGNGAIDEWIEIEALNGTPNKTGKKIRAKNLATRTGRMTEQLYPNSCTRTTVRCQPKHRTDV
jgi:hypothetical protein